MKPIVAIIFLCVCASSATAGGPPGAIGTSPRKYPSTALPIHYRVDQGSLGAFSNATAVTIANYAFQQWANVSTATVRVQNDGYLSHDVTSAADPLISGSTQYSDGINPIVFDNDGSI